MGGKLWSSPTLNKVFEKDQIYFPNSKEDTHFFARLSREWAHFQVAKSKIGRGCLTSVSEMMHIMQHMNQQMAFSIKPTKWSWSFPVSCWVIRCGSGRRMVTLQRPTGRIPLSWEASYTASLAVFARAPVSKADAGQGGPHTVFRRETPQC